MGYVCVKPTKGYASDIPNTKYILGVKRKYRIRGNNPEVEAGERTDYLNVKTFGIRRIKMKKDWMLVQEFILMEQYRPVGDMM